MKTISRNLTPSQTLIEYMRERGYTLEKIAERLDINVSTLRKIACGETKNPTQQIYSKLCDFYCCLLLEEENNKGGNTTC